MAFDAGSDMTPSSSDITVSRAGALLTITLNRPHRLNALTAPMLEDLAELATETSEDASVRAVVLTGAGRGFSSGADIGSQEGPATQDASGGDTLRAANAVVRALQAMPQPVVASVRGPVAGVGCSLALACDLVLAAESAYFLLAFAAIGLMPDGGATALVPASAGRARAMGMALVPDRVPAADALAWGLIYKVVPDDELTAATADLAGRLADGPPLALAATKRAINAAAHAHLEAALAAELTEQGRLLASADAAEGVAAFAERRKPLFTGK